MTGTAFVDPSICGTLGTVGYREKGGKFDDLDTFPFSLHFVFSSWLLLNAFVFILLSLFSLFSCWKMVSPLFLPLIFKC